MPFKHIKQDQRGVAMAMELVLVAVVLVAGGLIALRAYDQRKVATKPAAVSAVAATPKTNVDEAVKAVTSDASAESATAAQSDSDAKAVTANSSAATAVEGSIDESQF
jgi:hypothetical protein